MTVTLLEAFEQQIGWCARLGSPFTAALLQILAEDSAAGGVTASLLGKWPGDPVADAVPLRLSGALHALVLDGRDPMLQACYPPAPLVATDRLRRAVLATLEAHKGFVADFLRFPPQTNEVGRAGVLIGGFLTVAAETGLPLRLLEIGASAGLNGQWDRFGYQLGQAPWGDSASPVQLRPAWTGGLPPLGATVRVHSRAACDADPLDVRDSAQARRLRAYIWPDQTERLARLDAAIGLALANPLPVTPERAESWLPRRLDETAEGCAIVLYHSVMWQYLPDEARAAIRSVIENAGANAREHAPFAWLRFEPSADGTAMELALTLWPDGRFRRLATAHPHGQSVHWLA
jgi:hypothetical protein